jgi:hypothetical protein
MVVKLEGMIAFKKQQMSYVAATWTLIGPCQIFYFVS